MKKIFLSALGLALLSACATGSDLPSTEHSALPPRSINAQPGHSLPHVVFGTTKKQKKASKPRRRAPGNSEMWVTESDAESTYYIPVGVGNLDAFQPGSMVLLTFDCPVMMTATPNDAFTMKDFGNSVTIAAKEGAPTGVEVRLVVQACAINHKIVAKTTTGLGLAEARFESPDKDESPSIAGLCSDTNYVVDKVTKYGPTAACTVLDVTGANTATYFTLRDGMQQFPSVYSGDGKEGKPARTSHKRQPTGEILVRVQGFHEQLIVEFANGERAVLTRGR